MSRYEHVDVSHTLGRYASFHLHFDSLSEALGFPTGFTDKCFDEVAERFFTLSREFGFKYTISVIGKDLENPTHRNAIRRWAEEGHEIGNHTWSHRMDFGTLPQLELRAEIERAHGIIADSTGTAPTGFIAPAWCSSPQVNDVLMEFGYEYDTSMFPSWMLMPLTLRVALAYWGTARAERILKRRDYLRCLIGKRRPYLIEDRRGDRSLCSLPLPTNRWRFPCWHTTGFVFGWRIQRRLIGACLSEPWSFHYVLHPADLLTEADVPTGKEGILPRLQGTLEDKMHVLRDVIKQVAASGRQLVSLQTQARSHAQCLSACADISASANFSSRTSTGKPFRAA